MSTDHTVTARYDTVFHHAYAVEQPDLRRLYEQAKRDQWNVSRDIDWSRPVDLDSAVVADELIDIYGTPYWERLGPRERAELNRRFTAWRLSVLLYGEHGAMLACSQLVETVSGPDAKYFVATQVVDESRHTGFGMLSLPSTIAQLSESERREVEEFTCWSLGKVLTGLFPTEVYQEMGFSPAEINEIQHVRKARAVGGESSFFRQTFKKDLHGTLVQNLARIGVLTDHVRPKLESLGIRVPAHIG